MKKQLIPQAQFITAMAHLIEEYDSRDLLMKLQAKNLRNETGLWFDEHTGKLVGTKFWALIGDGKNPDHAWRYRQIDPKELVKTVKANLKRTYGNDWANDLKVFQATESLFDDKCFRKTAPGQYQVSGGHYGSILGYVLDYVVNGILSGDYARAHKAWETKHEYGGYGSKLETVGTHTSENFPGITVRVYANGRIDIKGLTPEQDNRLEAIGELAKRIKNTEPKYA